MKTPADKTITMTFHSHPVRLMHQRWTARLTFPPGATADTMLALSVTDGEEHPIAAGTLELAGLRLAVKNGAASIKFADFVAGKHEKGVWLHRRGMNPLPGGLTFE